MRPQPLIAVRDVQTSSLWYQMILGLSSAHGGSDYERLESDGRLVLQLHRWNDGPGDRRNLDHPTSASNGYGVLLWFETDRFDAVVERARALEAEVVEEPHVNPGPKHREIWLRDPDGYTIVVASPDGEAA